MVLLNKQLESSQILLTPNRDVSLFSKKTVSVPDVS